MRDSREDGELGLDPLCRVHVRMRQLRSRTSRPGGLFECLQSTPFLMKPGEYLKVFGASRAT